MPELMPQDLATAAVQAAVYVTGGLVGLWVLFYKYILGDKKEDKDALAKRDVEFVAVRVKVEKLERSVGRLEGRLTAYENCPAVECPFRKGPARYNQGHPLSEWPHKNDKHDTDQGNNGSA